MSTDLFCSPFRKKVPYFLFYLLFITRIICFLQVVTTKGLHFICRTLIESHRRQFNSSETSPTFFFFFRILDLPLPAFPLGIVLFYYSVNYPILVDILIFHHFPSLSPTHYYYSPYHSLIHLTSLHQYLWHQNLLPLQK